ncbi:helix-turn-helix domain-containing protein [Actinobacillus pleuropneumoniae]|nr:XRE family transcriptional regulator [Actinobacillus pleuropneumoniae]MCL7725893.1 helix-turn-helix domain-containing protein [Actinobacillus pleuropneumoniae]MCL7738921.1 helix-turn-helix domain-containing protein [Actinobacillus pleuropneumoniae]
MKEKKLREILKHNKLNRLKTFAEETTMCLDLKLSHLREELQITQQEIANKLQISQPSVVALEKRGTDKIIFHSTLYRRYRRTVTDCGCLTFR